MNNIIMKDETLDDLQINGIFVIQKKNAFRYGVDAVLLANFANIFRGAEVMDLCSGTGVVPFIIAGKTEAKHITGIEIQREMAEMSVRSTMYNNLQDKIDFIQGDISNINFIKSLKKVDIVTVNPPYKPKNSGIVSKDEKNAIARHEILCNLEDVIASSREVLKDNGKMYMVHRPERLVDIFSLMRKYNMEPKKVRMVYPSYDKPPSMVLIEGQKDGGKFLKWEKSLFIQDERGEYTEEINKIYGRTGEI